MKIPSSSRLSGSGLVIFSVICIFLARYCELLLHEWTHSTIAWLFGLFPNSSLFDISYGDWTLFEVDAMEFPNLSESDYFAALIADGHAMQAGLIAIGGPLTNAVLALICFYLLLINRRIRSVYALTFLFWFLAFNLGGIWSYIPLRVYSPHADIGFFLTAFQIEPGLFFIPATIISAAGVWIFFMKVIPRYGSRIGLVSRTGFLALTLGSAVIFFIDTIGPVLGSHPAGDLRGMILLPQFFFLCIVIIVRTATIFRRRSCLNDDAYPEADPDMSHS